MACIFYEMPYVFCGVAESVCKFPKKVFLIGRNCRQTVVWQTRAGGGAEFLL